MTDKMNKIRELRSKLLELVGLVDSIVDNDTGPINYTSRAGKQTYPADMDFRDDPDGLGRALGDLSARIGELRENSDEYDDERFQHALCLFTAEARCLQTQCRADSPNAETASNLIRFLGRIVHDENPGFVYGLNRSHVCDWGAKILELRNQRP